MALIGDMKAMDPRWLRPIRLKNYGVSLCVGIGVPIPILDMEMLQKVAIRNRDIQTLLFDYGVQNRDRPFIAIVDYEQLISGSIRIDSKTIPTAPMSDLRKAREIANVLKTEMSAGRFFLTEPVASLPGNQRIRNLENDRT